MSRGAGLTLADRFINSAIVVTRLPDLVAGCLGAGQELFFQTLDNHIKAPVKGDSFVAAEPRMWSGQ